MRIKTYFAAVILLSLIMISSAASVHAGNYLGYRWATPQTPFSITWGNNVNSTWSPLVQTAAANWSKSNSLDVTIVPGATSPTQCAITIGRVEVCNAKYGATGWYGLTQFAMSNGYIAGSSVKLNDSYKMTREYKTMIACHETGHTFGLDHQDTMFGNANLGTCLDYTNNPLSNQQPNTTDYNTLTEVYSINTAFSTLSTSTAIQLALVDLKSPKGWGRKVKESKDKGEAIFERDLGNGKSIITFATLVPGEQLRDEDKNPELSY
jgi:hypothetical protein